MRGHKLGRRRASLSIETLETRALLTGVALEPLLATGIAEGDQLGAAVAIDGATLLAGAPGTDAGAGAVHLFARSGIEWNEGARLVASDRQPGDAFGTAVSVDGDRLVVGAPQRTAGQRGAVYVFARQGDAWTEEARLAPADATDLRAFGQSVSIDGDVIVVGADTVPDDVGAAFVFRYDGGQWVEEQRLDTALPPSQPPGRTIDLHRFGAALDVSGDTIVVGAPRSRYDAMGQPVGAVLIYQHDENGWELKTGFADQARFFGASVEIDGDRFIGLSESTTGVYARSGDRWSREAKLDTFNLLDVPDGLNRASIGGQMAVAFDRVFEFQEGQWQPTTTLPIDPLSIRSVALADGQIVVGSTDRGVGGTAFIVRPEVRLTGQVWDDADRNGRRDEGEAPVPLLPVQLLDATDHVVASTRTDAAGVYAFGELPAGTYAVRVAPPIGTALSAQDQGDDMLDSDFDPVTGRTPAVRFEIGETATYDAGLFGTSGVTGVGSRVWNDRDGDGIRDDDDPPIAGLLVRLLDADGQQVAQTMTSDDGRYAFLDIAPGAYRVEFSPNHLFRQFTLPHQGDDPTRDSDVVHSSGTEPFSIITNQNDTSRDAGLLYTATTIHGIAWADANRDGIRQASEPALGGVRANLLDAEGSVIETRVTDAGGLYEFRTHFFRGETATLRVRIERPAGTAFSPAGAGDNRFADSDIDPSTGLSEPFEFNFSNASRVRNDVGLYGTSGVTEIGGLAWLDANGDGIRDDQESFAGGVDVRLFDAVGNLVATATTGEDGSYRFSGIDAGAYAVGIVLPEDALLSPMKRGEDRGRDSDVHRVTERTPLLPLATGRRVSGIDVGIFTGEVSTDVREHLRITEINPEREFVELMNTGPEPLDLTGVRFIDGIAFDFTFADLKTLFPEERLIIVPGEWEYRDAYDLTEVNVAGSYAGRLENSGERIELVAPINRVIQEFTYDREWYIVTDVGFSLVVRDPRMDTSLWSQRSGWRPSRFVGGSPGQINRPLALEPGSVVINEIMSNPANSKNDWIELFNTTDQPIDIGGWFLGDDVDGDPVFKRYRIAEGTIIPPGGFVTFTREENFGSFEDPGARDRFGLSSFGERLQLTAGDALGRLLGYSESVRFGGAEADVSFGRKVVPNGGQPQVHFVALERPTFGSINAIPKAGPVVINEIMYHPTFLGDEFLELHNVTVDPVDVGGWMIDGIRSEGERRFVLPEGTVVPANGYLLVVPIEPESFRAKYAIDADVAIVGPYLGTLDNAGESIRLLKSDERRREIVVDQIDYRPEFPWPSEANEGGGSLERVLPTRYGNDAENWRVTSRLGGTPGAANSVTSRVIGDLDLNGMVDVDDIGPFAAALVDPLPYSRRYGVQPNWTGDTDGDGDFDFDDLPGFVELIGEVADLLPSAIGADTPRGALQAAVHRGGHKFAAEAGDSEGGEPRELAAIWAPLRDWRAR